MRASPPARAGIAVVLIAVLLALVQPIRASASTRSELALLEAINDVRVANGLQPMKLAARLQHGAHVFARSLIERNVFMHSGESGVAEVLAWGTAEETSVGAIVQMWLESPSHRELLLWPGARRAGLGLAVGPFQGLPRVRLAVGRFAG